MKLSYWGGGEILTGGMSFCHENVFFQYKFAKGTTAYLKSKANKGEIVGVYIADVLLLNSPATLGRNVPIYVDNLNTLYNENELVTLHEAEDLVVISPFIKINEPVVFASAAEAFAARHQRYRSRPLRNCQVVNAASTTAQPKFHVGEAVFSKNAALLGQMEKIVIKAIYGTQSFIYEDTTGGLWNERELETQETAKTNALEYWQSTKKDIENELRSNAPPPN